ncbi:hypothetical protein H0H93_016611, partial [Arthromyces matolae]
MVLTVELRKRNAEGRRHLVGEDFVETNRAVEVPSRNEPVGVVETADREVAVHHSRARVAGSPMGIRTRRTLVGYATRRRNSLEHQIRDAEVDDFGTVTAS